MRISVNYLDNTHNDCLRALDFYKHEIDILKGRLTEVAGKNTNKEVLHKAERFENQLSIQRNNIDSLKHDIHHNLQQIKDELSTQKAGYIDAILHTQHNNLYAKFKMEERIINELRHDFNDFAAGWM